MEPLKDCTNKNRKDYKHIYTEIPGWNRKQRSVVFGTTYTAAVDIYWVRRSCSFFAKDRLGVGSANRSLKTARIFLKRKSNECWVDMYMQNILHVWKANMDCQFCLDAYSVIIYIVNYVSKQARGLSLSLNQVMKECKRNSSGIKEAVKALGNVFLKSLELSVQEVIYVLLGLPLTYLSRDVVSIATQPEEEWAKVIKHVQQLRYCRPQDTDIYMTDKFDMYIRRPPALEEICLADFWCKLQHKKATGHNSRGPKVIAKSASVIYSSRRRAKILSYICPTKQEDAENYYRIRRKRLETRVQQFWVGVKGLSKEESTVFVENYSWYNQENIHHLYELLQSVESAATWRKARKPPSTSFSVGNSLRMTS